jgi:hypothetical protein
VEKTFPGAKGLSGGFGKACDGIKAVGTLQGSKFPVKELDKGWRVNSFRVQAFGLGALGEKG